MAKKSGIYSITHSASGKCYVGSAVSIGARFSQHRTALERGKHQNSKLQHAWSKYGNGAFTFEVVELVADRAQLIAREQFWMGELGAMNGYNIAPTAGSCLGRKLSDETRRKISESRKNSPTRPEWLAAMRRRRVPEEVKEKIRAGHVGVPKAKWTPERFAHMAVVMTGKKHTAEAIRKISESKKGCAFSDEARSKMSASAQGKVLSEGTKRKISEAVKGRIYSAETIAKRVATRAENKRLKAFQA